MGWVYALIIAILVLAGTADADASPVQQQFFMQQPHYDLLLATAGILLIFACLMFLWSREFREMWCWLRWGDLREETRAIDGGVVSEFAVISERTGETVGYWAYGHYDPKLPYTGQLER